MAVTVLRDGKEVGHLEMADGKVAWRSTDKALTVAIREIESAGGFTYRGPSKVKHGGLRADTLTVTPLTEKNLFLIIDFLPNGYDVEVA